MSRQGTETSCRETGRKLCMWDCTFLALQVVLAASGGEMLKVVR